MSYRKVQKTSKGTFLISLPKDWASAYGLEKEDALLVTEQKDGSLAIHPPRKKAKEISAKLKYVPYISRYVTWCYLMGVDSLEVVGDGPLSKGQRDEVREAAEKLAGFEVLDERDDGITLGTLLEAGPGSAEKYIRKELYVTTGMEREALAAFFTGNAEAAKAVEERDDEVDRLYFLLVRLSRGTIANTYISERLGLDPMTALDIREASEILENLADYAVKISRMVDQKRSVTLPYEVREKTSRFIDELISVQERALDSVIEHAFSSVPTLLDKKPELFELLEFPINQQKCDLVALLDLKGVLSQMLERSYDLVDLVAPSTAKGESGELIFYRHVMTPQTLPTQGAAQHSPLRRLLSHDAHR